MHYSKKCCVVVMISLLGLFSCASSDRGQQESSGMVIGGIIGGVLGNRLGDGTGRTVATVVGTIIGTTIGGNIGRKMDDADRLKVAHSLETVRTGVGTRWVNPDTGASYKVVPTKTYDEGGSPCREFTLEASIGGDPETVYGTACRQADGSWKMKQ